jgi:hypothetical protein
MENWRAAVGRKRPEHDDRINSFDREYSVTIRPLPGEPAKVSTLGAFVRMLWVAFAFSIGGALYVIAPAVQKLCGHGA